MGKEEELVSLKITLQYADLDEFVLRYADNISSAGIFIRTKAPKPAGTKVRFELLLKDGQSALEGEGVVVGTGRDDHAGMSVRFHELPAPSKSVVGRIVDEHGEGTLAPTPLASMVNRSRKGSTGPARPPFSPFGLRNSRLPRSPLASKPTQYRGTRPSAPSAPSPGPQLIDPPPHASEMELEPTEKAVRPVGVSQASKGGTDQSEDTPSEETADLGAAANDVALEPVSDSPATTIPEVAGFNADLLEDAHSDENRDLASDIAELGPPSQPPKAEASSHPPQSAELSAPPGGSTDENDGSQTLDTIDDTVELATERWDEEFDASNPDLIDLPPEVTTADGNPHFPVEDDLNALSEVHVLEPILSDEVETEVASNTTPPPAADPSGRPAVSSVTPEEALARTPSRPLEGIANLNSPQTSPGRSESGVDGPARAHSTPKGDTGPARGAAMPTLPPFELGPAPSGFGSRLNTVSPPQPESSSSGGLKATESEAPVFEAPTDPEDIESRKPTVRPGLKRVGLDLGSRTLRLGYLEGNELQAIEVLNRQAVPAWVAMDDDGQLQLGQTAKRIAEAHPDRAISPVELLRSLGGLEATHGQLHQSAQVALGASLFEPQAIFRTLLSAVQAAWRAHFGHDRVSLHISIPPNLSADAIKLLRSVCADLGIQEFHFEPSPQVLLRAYHLHEHFTSNALTIFLGPRRLATSVARRNDDDLVVLRSEETHGLGAEMIDAAIAKLAAQSLFEATGREFTENSEVMARLTSAAEVARPELRYAKTLELPVRLPDETEKRVVSVARVDIEDATRDFVTQVLRAVRKTLEEVDLEPRYVAAIVLAGTAGDFPPLIEALNNFFGREPLNSVPSSTAVLLGLVRPEARSHREILHPEQGLVTSVGIAIPGERFLPLVHAGTPLPASLARSVPAPRGRKTAAQVELLQGEGESVRLCTSLGVLELEELPAGTPHLELQLEIDTDGVLVAKLREVSTNRLFRLVVPTQQTSASARRKLTSVSNEADRERGFFGRLFGR